MPALRKFITEWFREWWGLMGCAAFTLLGIYVAYANKSNAWVVGSSIALGTVFFFVASFRAWKRQYDEKVALRSAKSTLELNLAKERESPNGPLVVAEYFFGENDNRK